MLMAQAIDELRKTKIFQEMRPGVDEEEHSLEMHLPYIRHIFTGYVSGRYMSKMWSCHTVQEGRSAIGTAVGRASESEYTGGAG